jgi:hypothetical protein
MRALFDADSFWLAQGIPGFAASCRRLVIWGPSPLHQLGFEDLTLYDGSMGEWAKDPALPIEKG